VAGFLFSPSRRLAIIEMATASGLALLNNNTLDPMQATAATELEYIAPDTPRTVCPVTAQEALPDPTPQAVIIDRTPTRRPDQPAVEPCPRDTERLAHHRHRPGPSVLRHEAELHVDSLAK